jgi:anti-anti-sigma regulatory factor
MSISHKVSVGGKKVKININGRLDYNVSREFPDAYSHLPGREGMVYLIDFNDIDHTGSSALGMLLLLREYENAEVVRWS